MTPEKRYPLTLLLSLIVVMLVCVLMAFYIGIKIGYEAGAERKAENKKTETAIVPYVDTGDYTTSGTRKDVWDSVYATSVYSLKCPDSSFSQKKLTP